MTQPLPEGNSVIKIVQADDSLLAYEIETGETTPITLKDIYANYEIKYMQNFDHLALAIAVNTEDEAEKNYNQKLKPPSDSTSDKTEINHDIDTETGKQLDSCQDSAKQHTPRRNEVESTGRKVSKIRDLDEGNIRNRNVAASQKPERRIGESRGQFLCKLSCLNQGHVQENSNDSSDSGSCDDEYDND